MVSFRSLCRIASITTHGRRACPPDYLHELLRATCQLLVDKWLGAMRREAGGQARHLRVVMEAMRHCDLKLTMKTYTDASQLPVGAALHRLPWSLRPALERMRDEG